ncbi:tetratricopeptide (TPR) repeat protein [Streptacidiphilus sp. EB103A]
MARSRPYATGQRQDATGGDVSTQKGMAEWGYELFMERWRERRCGLARESDAGKGVLPGGFEPCLVTLFRLLASRDVDGAREPVPLWHLRALARTGHLARAAELAFTISDEPKQGEALLALVEEAAGAGDLLGAQALVDSIRVRDCHDRALVALVPAWARAGELDRALALAERVRYPHNWSITWALLAKALADTGDFRGALDFADRAAGSASSRVLTLLLDVATAAGDHVRAGDLVDRLEDLARFHGPGGGGHDRGGPRPLTAILVPEVGLGDLDRLDALLRRPGTSPLYPAVMVDVLEAAAETAEADVVLALVERTQTLLDACSPTSWHADDLRTAAALMLARHGHVEWAMAFADAMNAPHRRAGWQAEIVGELARGGDTGRAETLAHAITDRRARARALIAVVEELARRGETDRAQALTRAIPDLWARGHALVPVVEELARRGETERAEALADTIAFRETRDRALFVVAGLAAPSDARRLAARLAALGGWYGITGLLEQLAPQGVTAVTDALTACPVTE